VASSSSAEADNADLAFFEAKVRPVLVEKCYACHSAEAKKLKGELRLDSRAGLMRGGESGPAITPGKSAESLLITAVSSTDADLKMPPKKPLPATVVEDLKRWVEMGAPWPAEAPPAPVVAKPEGKSHWAFQPVRSADASDAAPPWERIDRFIATKLESRGLRPLPPADRRTLIRRASFDLTGLPPESAAVEAFVADDAPDAFARVLDRLLASPNYGERWGRYWLDLARYADTNGADENYTYPNAWRYRDYVVRSFNADKPYDRFVIEQVAGDLLVEDESPEGELRRQDNLIATGFLLLGPKMLAEQDKPKLVMDVVDEQIDVTGQTFLGLTLGCARCHDHKFDPISQADYYALGGIFKSTKSMAHLKHVSEWNERRLEKTPPGAEGPKPPPPAKKADASKKQNDAPRAMAVAEGTPQDLPIYKRGSHLAPGNTMVPRGFPAVLTDGAKPPAISPSQSGRLELANWLADPANPLTARVMVNRIWQGHFGVGLVESSSNFGVRGATPTHPELLDWLAAHFVRGGWSIKQMHRAIMRSAAYQRSSVGGAPEAATDPENHLLWRQNRRRLEAEAVRDALLAASGNLDGTAGGSPKVPTNEKYVSIKNEAEVYASTRRSLYLPIVRTRMYDFFNIFDYVDAGVHTARRSATVVPQQALFMLNSELANAQAALLAGRLLADSTRDDAARVDEAYQRLYGRPASPQEIARAAAHLAAMKPEESSANRTAAWTSLCRVLFAANEFIYLN